VARAVSVSRATIAQWEASSHLPSAAKLALLDAFLEADGALSKLAGQEREGARSGAAPEPGQAGTTLLEVFRQVDQALDQKLQRDERGRPLGWCHNLQMPDKPSPFSTAYGIKAALLIEEVHRSEIGSLAARLNEMSQAGGWAATSQGAPRPEAIAVVVDALVRVDLTADIDERFRQLEASVDETTRQRPSLLATILETVLDLRPDSAFALDLIRSLLDSRHPHGPDNLLLWSQKNEPGLAYPQPSSLHTARAVCVLARAEGANVADEVRSDIDEALGAAVGWLARRTDLDLTSEPVVRRTGARSEVLYLRHFTASWVARALLLAGEPVSHPAVKEALRQTWTSFSPEHALWRWESGDLPIWMTFDGIATLRLAALAGFLPDLY
jgi:transcriptional regulator with XRE-family HTH domain